MPMRLPPLATTLLLLATSASAQWKYPATKTVDASDTHFGKTYPDPYRWLEDTKSQEAETWFKDQAALTDGVLAKLPGRDALAAEWLELHKREPANYWNFRMAKGRVFYKKLLPDETIGKLYMRESWTGAEKLLLDPATYKSAALATGAPSTINDMVPSWDGKYVALGFSSGGAEWSELRVLDVASGALLPDAIYPSRGAYGWTNDNKSFFYDGGKITDLKSPRIQLNRQTRLHRLGTDPSTDIDFFSNEVNPELNIDPKEWPMAFIDQDWPHPLVAFVSTVQSEIKVYTAPFSELKNKGKKIGWKPLCQPRDKLVRSLYLHGDSAYAVSYASASRYKVVRTSVKKPDWANADIVLPEAADSVQYLAMSKGVLLAVYSNGVVGRLVKYDLATGKSAEVKLPVSGSIDVSCPDLESDRCLISVSSWIDRPRYYDYDAAKGTLVKSVFDTHAEMPGFDQLVVEEVEVPSHDGAMVPLSIIYKKGLKLDGSNPAILEGYGSYGSSYTPYFHPKHSVALRGVVVAYAHPRGGGEKGEAWYRGGFKATKPNTWKDYIACAEYLVKKGYTSPRKLGGTGTSAGGILISRSITDRPDLFGAVVCNVGTANALRMEFSPNGPINTPEFGTVANRDEADALYEMDGVQHVKKGVQYPAVLGVVGWNDPRVAPWQTGKLVAAMQTASTSGKPVLIKVNYDNGHFTEDMLVTYKNLAGQYAFLLWQAGHQDFQPKAP